MPRDEAEHERIPNLFQPCTNILPFVSFGASSTIKFIMVNMSPCSTAFANLIIFFSSLVLSASNCYYPNSDLASTHTPCDVSAETSACCNPGDLRLSNGYCFQQFSAWSNRLARGSCTDGTWGNSICPKHCDDRRSSPAAQRPLCSAIPDNN
jgi:hypothetical protein